MFWRLSEPTPNGPMAAHTLCSQLDIPVTASTLKREIEDHPSYPSLLSISEVLTKYGIENISASFSHEQLAVIPPPFLAQIKDKNHTGDYFTVIKSCIENRVTYQDPHSGKWTEMDVARFSAIFNGIVLMAEPLPNAGESEYKIRRKEEKWNQIKSYLPAAVLFSLALAASINAFSVTGAAAMLPVIYMMLSMLGCGIGAILLWFDIDRFNPSIQQFCRSGKKVNCNAVLQSHSAKVAGFSWSDIGLSYFVAQILFLLTQGIHSPFTIAAAEWMSLLAVPYVIYSLYVQSNVLKQWCLMCLLVQGLLFVQAIIGVVTLASGNIDFPILSISIYAVFLASAFLLVQILKPILKQNKQFRHIKRQYTRLRFQPEVFQSILQRQRQFTHAPTDLGLVMGNPDAMHTVVKVCNPYCGPCATAHAPLHELAELNENVKVQIIFTATEEPDDHRRLPVSHLMAIAEEYGSDKVKTALDAWYLAKVKDYDKFAEQFPVKADLQQKNMKIAAMSEWCRTVGIDHTPTLFINNYELPESYSVHDLRNFLTT